MAIWRRKQSAETSMSYVRGAAADGRIRIPKGHVPMVLVGDEEDGEERRVLVHVRTLKEPCMAALLEMAEQRFGYSQQGVLRIPCDALRFEQMVNTACKTA